MALSKIGLALLGGATILAASGCTYSEGPGNRQRSHTVQVQPVQPAYVHYRRHNTAAYGTVYLNTNGRALYTRQHDRRNQSRCYGNCARKWPPYLAGSNARPHGQWAIVNRRDGTRQWTYAGRPTYMWSGDRSQGQVNGHRRDGTWSVLRSQQN